MNIAKNHSLKQLNTFGIEAHAEQFATIHSPDELVRLIQHRSLPIFILGGGSNLLLCDDLPWLVVHNQIKGIEIIRRFKNRVWVKIGGGENWHQFVLWALKNGLGGVENLSLIPGTVGASPVQNIGAYGVEIQDVFIRLEAIDLKTGKRKTFSKKACEFGYRASVFKSIYKGAYCITSVTLSLTSQHHKLHTSYGAIREELTKNNVPNPGIADISRAVIAIRSSKLPDPAELGNSGSFFKNPVVSQSHFAQIQASYPDMPFYRIDAESVKIPAAWLIQTCGWKGKRIGAVGSHHIQPLVLVNHGGASGREVKQFAMDLIASIEKKFGITLVPEVNLLP
ncbi:MAG: UDP-N-acetylmuramate dehydrogenase [Saprospiraceae bacterium]